MALKRRIEQLHAKLPRRQTPYSMCWVDPETGQIFYRLTVDPQATGEKAVVEQWGENPTVTSDRRKRRTTQGRGRVV